MYCIGCQVIGHHDWDEKVTLIWKNRYIGEVSKLNWCGYSSSALNVVIRRLRRRWFISFQLIECINSDSQCCTQYSIFNMNSVQKTEPTSIVDPTKLLLYVHVYNINKKKIEINKNARLWTKNIVKCRHALSANWQVPKKLSWWSMMVIDKLSFKIIRFITNVIFICT